MPVRQRRFVSLFSASLALVCSIAHAEQPKIEIPPDQMGEEVYDGPAHGTDKKKHEEKKSEPSRHENQKGGEGKKDEPTQAPPTKASGEEEKASHGEEALEKKSEENVPAEAKGEDTSKTEEEGVDDDIHNKFIEASNEAEPEKGRTGIFWFAGVFIALVVVIFVML